MVFLRRFLTSFKHQVQEAIRMATFQGTSVSPQTPSPLPLPLPLPQRQLFLPLHQPLPLLQLPLGIRNQVPTHRYHTIPRTCPCHFLQRSAYHVN